MSQYFTKKTHLLAWVFDGKLYLLPVLYCRIFLLQDWFACPLSVDWLFCHGGICAKVDQCSSGHAVGTRSSMHPVFQQQFRYTCIYMHICVFLSIYIYIYFQSIVSWDSCNKKMRPLALPVLRVHMLDYVSATSDASFHKAHWAFNLMDQYLSEIWALSWTSNNFSLQDLQCFEIFAGTSGVYKAFRLILIWAYREFPMIIWCVCVLHLSLSPSGPPLHPSEVDAGWRQLDMTWTSTRTLWILQVCFLVCIKCEAGYSDSEFFKHYNH